MKTEWDVFSDHLQKTKIIFTTEDGQPVMTETI